MKCSFQPYEGPEPYCFVSYSHADAERVAPVLDYLHRGGLRIWYDEGIEWGSEWPDSIARHLQGARVCLLFHSRTSLESQNCRQEIYYANQNRKEKLSIFLENVQLPPGLDMQLSAVQATYAWQYDRPEQFLARLAKLPLLQSCRAAAPEPAAPAPRKAEDLTALPSETLLIRLQPLPLPESRARLPLDSRYADAFSRALSAADCLAVLGFRQAAEEEYQRAANAAGMDQQSLWQLHHDWFTGSDPTAGPVVTAAVYRTMTGLYRKNPTPDLRDDLLLAAAALAGQMRDEDTPDPLAGVLPLLETTDGVTREERQHRLVFVTRAALQFLLDQHRPQPLSRLTMVPGVLAALLPGLIQQRLADQPDGEECYILSELCLLLVWWLTPREQHTLALTLARTGLRLREMAFGLPRTLTGREASKLASLRQAIADCLFLLEPTPDRRQEGLRLYRQCLDVWKEGTTAAEWQDALNICGILLSEQGADPELLRTGIRLLDRLQTLPDSRPDRREVSCNYCRDVLPLLHEPADQIALLRLWVKAVRQDPPPALPDPRQQELRKAIADCADMLPPENSGGMLPFFSWHNGSSAYRDQLETLLRQLETGV